MIIQGLKAAKANATELASLRGFTFYVFKHNTKRGFYYVDYFNKLQYRRNPLWAVRPDGRPVQMRITANSKKPPLPPRPKLEPKPEPILPGKIKELEAQLTRNEANERSKLLLGLREGQQLRQRQLKNRERLENLWGNSTRGAREARSDKTIESSTINYNSTITDNEKEK